MTIEELKARHRQAARFADTAAKLAAELKVAEYAAELEMREAEGTRPARQAFLRWYITPEAQREGSFEDLALAMEQESAALQAQKLGLSM